MIKDSKYLTRESLELLDNALMEWTKPMGNTVQGWDMNRFEPKGGIEGYQFTLQTLRKIVENSDRHYSKVIEPLIVALQMIVDLELPATGKTFEDGSSVPYWVCYGGLGVQEYLREVAAIGLQRFWEACDKQ